MLVFNDSFLRRRHKANLANNKRTLAGKRKKNLGGETTDEPLMKSFGNLVSVTAKAAMRENRQILQVISQIVPASTLAHIEFCRIEGGRMRVTVDSAVWVSRLRFSERQIIAALREKHLDCHTLSYHVSPAEKPKPRKTVRSANSHLSGATALERAANGISTPAAGDESESGANDDLKEQLLKLAQALRARQ